MDDVARSFAKKLICISGLLGCGKSTVAAYLVEHYGGVVANFSDPLKDIAKRLHVPANRETLQALGQHVCEAIGHAGLARTMLVDNANVPAKLVIITGLRYEPQLTFFRQVPHFLHLAVDASFESRFQRANARGQYVGDQTDRAAFQRLNERDTERHVPGIMQQADVILRNDGDVQDLYRQVDAAVQRFFV